MQINWDFLEQKEQTNQVPDIYDLARQGEEFLAEKERLSQVLGLNDSTPDSDANSPMFLNIVNPVLRYLSYLDRPRNAVASWFDQFVFGEGDEPLPFTESLKQIPAAFSAFGEGWRGERQTYYGNLLKKAGWPSDPIVPAWEGKPILGSSLADIGGFGMDVRLDPLSLLGILSLNRAGRAAQRAEKLAGLRSVQALRGHRDLFTIRGYGPSSLPGRLGEAARSGTASFYRGFERVGERMASTEAGRRFINALTTKGVGPVRAIRERLRGRDAEERYLTRQATRQYGRMDRNITDLANKYDLDPEQLRQYIVQESERKLHSVDVLQPGAVSGPPDPAALPGVADVATDLVARWREAPVMEYKVRQGDTLSEIALRFGTTVDDLSKRNNITDPNRIRAGQTLEIPTPEEIVKVIDDIKEAQPRRLQAERSVGVMTPEFESEHIDYLHRLITEEFGDRLSKDAKDFFQSGRPVLSLSHGAQKARTIAPDNYIREINQAAVEGRFKKVWLDADGNIVKEGTSGSRLQYVITEERLGKESALPRVPIFSEDPAVIELARERMSIRSVTSAKAIDDILDMGFSEGWASRIVDDDAVQNALNKGWRTVQAPRFHNKFKDVYFPKEVAEELTRFVDLFEPKQLNKLQRLFKGAFDWWKTMTLSPIPEYHMRNMGTGFVKNYYEGLLPGDPAYLEGQLFAVLRLSDNMAPRMRVADDFYDALSQSKMARIRTRDGKEYTLEQILDWYEAEQLSFGYFSSHFGGPETAQQALRGSGAPLWQKLNPLSSQSYLVDAGQTFGTYIEDGLRGSLFIKKLKEGYSPHEAANAVRRVHFDYNDIPEWARKARASYSPFITWAIKNLPHELSMMIQHPGKISRLTSTVRFIESSQGGELPDPYTIPSFLLMPVYVGDNEEGQPMYGNVLQMWGMTDLVEFADNPLHYLIGQLHPFVAQLWEQPMNIDTFMNRPIVNPELEDVRRDMIRTGEIPLGSMDWASTTLLGSMQPTGAFNLPARAEHFMRMFRPYSLVSRFMDPDTTTQDALIRTLTGYTTYPANEWFSGPVYHNNAENAAWYYRNQATSAKQRMQEAIDRGDTRAAFMYQQEAEKWERLLEEWVPRFGASLEALER